MFGLISTFSFSFLGLLSKYHKTGRLKTTEVDSLTVLEARSLNQGVCKVGSSWVLWGRVCSMPFSLLSVLQAVLGVPWLIGASLQSLPLSSHDISWCGSASLLLVRKKGPLYSNVTSS